MLGIKEKSYVGSQSSTEPKVQKFSDIILSSIITVIFVFVAYALCERLGYVPIINLRYNGIYLVGREEKLLTVGETMIFIVIMFECAWISAQILYWKLRGFKITL